MTDAYSAGYLDAYKGLEPVYEPGDEEYIRGYEDGVYDWLLDNGYTE